MSLLALREHWVLRLRDAIDKLTVEPQAGRFNLAELKRFSLRKPAVLVAVLNVPNLEDDNRAEAIAQMAAYIVTSTDRKFTADERALVLAQTILRELSQFSDTELDTPTRASWQNLYSDDVGSEGVHLSVVTWRQKVDLVDTADAPDLAAFLTFHADFDLGPSPDGDAEASDTTELPQ